MDSRGEQARRPYEQVLLAFRPGEHAGEHVLGFICGQAFSDDMLVAVA